MCHFSFVGLPPHNKMPENVGKYRNMYVYIYMEHQLFFWCVIRDFPQPKIQPQQQTSSAKQANQLPHPWWHIQLNGSWCLKPLIFFTTSAATTDIKGSERAQRQVKPQTIPWSWGERWRVVGGPCLGGEVAGAYFLNKNGKRRYKIILTPWKINMEPTNHPFRKENDLLNLRDYTPC